MRFGVIVFPGSNCDHDCRYAIEKMIGVPVLMIAHKEEKLPQVDVLILPGGFSYGDYLRTGAIACTAPIMKAVIPFAKNGGRVLGICNGFQILTETGLLPGVLLRNKSLKFICRSVYITCDNNNTSFTSLYQKGETISVPIAHGEGNYYIDEAGLASLKENNQIVFCYTNASGLCSEETNPNGSVLSIAGICNKEGNILGMMPHPERVSDPILGAVDGLKLFLSLNK
jgi:phosphoribosylformylglycinamidine synthase